MNGPRMAKEIEMKGEVLLTVVLVSAVVLMVWTAGCDAKTQRGTDKSSAPVSTVSPKVTLHTKERVLGRVEINTRPWGVLISPDGLQATVYSRPRRDDDEDVILEMKELEPAKPYPVEEPRQKTRFILRDLGPPPRGGIRLVVNGVEGPIIKGPLIKNSVAVSPDGSRYAYVVGTGESNSECTVVVDGKERHFRVSSPKAEELLPYGYYPGPPMPVFSPDSKHVAYIAQAEGRMMLVLDGVEGPRHDYIECRNRVSPVFSPDSKYVVYLAIDRDPWAGDEIDPEIRQDRMDPARSPPVLRFFVNGVPSRMYEGHFEETRIVFTSPNSFAAIVRRRNQVLRVDIRIKKA